MKSQEEAITQIGQAATFLLDPGESDTQTVERIVSSTLAAQRAQQAATAQAVGANANCRFTRVEVSCPASQATQDLAPATARGPIRWGGGSTTTIGSCTVTIEWECTPA